MRKKKVRFLLSKLDSSKIVNCSISNYLIDWDKKSRSKPQTLVKDFLFVFWRNDCVCEEFRVPGSLLRCDFVNFTKKIIIEVSPEQHISFNKFFHHNRLGFLNSLKRDFAKEEWAKTNSFYFCHINNEDLKLLTKDYFKEKFDIEL